MKKTIIIFAILFGFFGKSQTHRFVYELQYKRDSLSDHYDKENMALDINPDEVKFYPYSYAENDSLNKVRNQMNSTWDDLPALKRKKSSDENTNFYLLGDAFLMTKTTDKISWKLSAETKTENGYNLQKATAKFGGRNWIAWFNKDIPLNEGPYKFYGLPGLVFEVEDDKANFIFKLVKSYKLAKTYDTSVFLESYAGQKAVLISEKLLNKKQLEMYNDPLHDFREMYKNNPGGTFKVYNIEIKNIDQFKELSEMVQKRMRKENNPIELDKAVKYPEK
ncbi:MAG: GLPGLI family protein [Bergeyella sp.]